MSDVYPSDGFVHFLDYPLSVRQRIWANLYGMFQASGPGVNRNELHDDDAYIVDSGEFGGIYFDPNDPIVPSVIVALTWTPDYWLSDTLEHSLNDPSDPGVKRYRRMARDAESRGELPSYHVIVDNEYYGTSSDMGSYLRAFDAADAAEDVSEQVPPPDRPYTRVYVAESRDGALYLAAGTFDTAFDGWPRPFRSGGGA